VSEMIRANNVRVEFGHRWTKNRTRALDDFSLSIDQGDVFALLGPNGAGKSTAMYCLLGMIRPDGGSVRIMGKSPEPGAELFRKIAYLPEEPHYHLYLTVGEALNYYGALYGKPIAPGRIDEILEMLELSDARDKKLEKCSKGMKQKVGIGQCIIHEPEILFMDEPTRGLDPLTVKTLRKIILELNGRGTTIVINSHVLSEIEMVCKRVAIMKKGRVVLEDSLANIKKQDNDIYEVRFSTTAEIPDYIKIIQQQDQIMTAEIEIAMLNLFFDYLEISDCKLIDCSLRQRSLEDLLFSVLTEEN